MKQAQNLDFTGLNIGEMWPMAAFFEKAWIVVFLQHSHSKQSAKASSS